MALVHPADGTVGPSDTVNGGTVFAEEVPEYMKQEEQPEEYKNKTNNGETFLHPNNLPKKLIASVNSGTTNQTHPSTT